MKGLYISCSFNENFREWKLFMNFNLGEGEDGNFNPCWISPNNSEMVKDLILQSVATHQKHPCQHPSFTYTSPQILDKFQTVIFFIISETVTTFTSNLNHVLNLLREIDSKVKKFDINVLLTNYDFIFICQVFTRFGAIRKPDFGRVVHELSTFISINFFN